MFDRFEATAFDARVPNAEEKKAAVADAVSKLVGSFESRVVPVNGVYGNIEKDED